MESRSLKRARRIPWLTGVVLAGGESRRMGQPKAWMNAWGEPLLVRTVRTVSRVCASVVVVGAPGQVLPTVRARVVRDMAEGEGPLRGMEAGLGAVRTRAAFVCAVDLPFLRDDLIRLLAENLVAESLGEAEACVPRWHRRAQPLQAIYLKQALVWVRMLLRKGKRRPLDLLSRLSVCYVGKREILRVDPEGESFLNANTKRDWAAVLRRSPKRRK